MAGRAAVPQGSRPGDVGRGKNRNAVVTGVPSVSAPDAEGGEQRENQRADRRCPVPGHDHDREVAFRRKIRPGAFPGGGRATIEP